MSARGETLVITTKTGFFVESCYACGVLFAMTMEFKDNRRQDHVNFYCPNGHGQRYTGKTDAQRIAELEQALASRADDVRVARLDVSKAKAETVRLRKRIEAGVCPHCKRTFQNVARHVKSKHQSKNQSNDR